MRASSDPTAERRAAGSDESAARRGLLHRPYRLARRIGIALVGSLVLLVGIVFLVTPGPAVIVIPMGLGILALEFEWAERWLDNIKDRIGTVLPSARRRPREPDGAPGER